MWYKFESYIKSPVGVYHIVAVFPGADYILNGTSDPTITVLSRPIIRLSIPYVVLKDTILNIHGEILDMDGSKIRKTSIKRSL